MIRRLTTLLALAGAMLLAGCNSNPLTPSANSNAVADVDLITTTHEAAGALVTGLNKDAVNLSAPILVASFVNTDDLTESSTFGRIASEQVATELTNKGYQVAEMKLRSNVFIKKSAGEFVLSREVADLVAEYKAQAVLAGIYAPGRDEVYVTIKLIRVTDNVVLASHDFSVPMGPNVRMMLRTKRNS